MNATLQHAIAARQISVVGWGLIVLAFVVPFASAAMGYGNAAHAGYQAGQLAIGLVVLISATNRALKANSALVQSCGRVVIGVLLTLWALGSAWEQFQIAKLKEFVIEARQIVALQEDRFVELGKRFDAIDLHTVLTAEALSSDAGIAAGRATISNYRALLTERNSQVTNSYAAIEHFVNTRSSNEAVKRKTLAAMEGPKGATINNYGALNAAQSAEANAMSDVLDWATTQKGKLAIENGRLAFASQPQQIELQALIAKILPTEAWQRTILQVMAASRQNSQASLRENNEKLQQLLK